GRVAVPADGVAARPVAGRHGADVERHADAVARVEARAAHLGELPAGPQVARAHLGVGLEAAGGQHHALGHDVDGLAGALHAHALDAVSVGDEGDGARAIGDGDIVLASDASQRLHKPRTAAPGLDGQPAPELELAADLVGLPPPDRHEAY